MGWGVLRGLGKGIGGYAEILGKKNEMDFQNKKDDLAFKRQQSLESIRAQNNRAQAEQKRGWQLEDQERADDKSIIDAQAKEATYQKRRGEKRADFKWQIGFNKKLSDADKVAKAAAKEEKFNEMQQAPWYQALSDKDKDAVEAEFMFDITIPKGSKRKEPTDAMLKMAEENLMRQDGFDEQSPYEQARQTRLLALGYANDPEKVNSKMSGEYSEGPSFDPEKDIPIIKSMIYRASGGDNSAKAEVNAAIAAIAASEPSTARKLKELLPEDWESPARENISMMDKALDREIGRRPQTQVAKSRQLVGDDPAQRARARAALNR